MSPEAIIYVRSSLVRIDDELLKLLEEGGIHAMTFTSSSNDYQLHEHVETYGIARSFCLY